MGGHGKRRTPDLAARFAAEFNVGFSPAAEVAELVDGVRAACLAVDRDPAGLTCSVAHILCCGTTAADLDRRADDARNTVAELRAAEAFVGSPDEVVDRIGRFAAVGASRCYLQFNGLADLRHLDLVAERVMPQLS